MATLAWEVVQRGGEYLTVAELLGRPAWHGDALCREHPEIDFFPARGESTEPAKAICDRCAVRAECLAWALSPVDANESDVDGARIGVWGGTSERERRLMRRDGLVEPPPSKGSGGNVFTDARTDSCELCAALGFDAATKTVSDVGGVLGGLTSLCGWHYAFVRRHRATPSAEQVARHYAGGRVRLKGRTARHQPHASPTRGRESVRTNGNR